MKIGFLALTMWLERYWQKLSGKADCWLGVVDPKLLIHLIKQGDIDKIVYYHGGHIIDKNKEFGNKLVSANRGLSEKIIFETINPDIWISESPRAFKHALKKTLWVQAFSALPLKKYNFHEDLKEYDLVLLPGEYHRENLIKRLGLQPRDEERLKIVGWPRVDSFFDGTYNKEEIIKKIGLNPDKKTVMYAPTWGAWNQQQQGYGHDLLFVRWFKQKVEIFEKLCNEINEMNLNFIFRPHFLSFDAENEVLIDIAKKYDVLWQTNKVSGAAIDDPNTYLWVTDILISDLSGIITDFLTLDRPIIYIDPDESLNVWDGADMPKSFRPGHVVRTPEELCEAIKDSVLCPERYSEERKLLTSKLFYNLDGKATDRAVEAILDFAANKGLK